LVRVCLCDNFFRSAHHALHIFKETARRLTIRMNQEFLQEYEKLSKKAHDLREYL
jgi:predicted  nucleic acid-binding Zn-ribbon protein